MELFKPDDFKVFDIKGFNERMAAILTRIRPKLASIGQALEPKLSQAVDSPLYVHVAKHARRTVNPPNDTWAALGTSQRGYKKDVHFKVAVSRNCVRFLFEAGLEYYAKEEWVRGWNSGFKGFASSIKSAKGLSWFRNEHDEEPASQLAELDSAGIKALAGELTRRKDGQFVLGVRIPESKFVGLSEKQVETLAMAAFGPLAPLFHIHEARVLE